MKGQSKLFLMTAAALFGVGSQAIAATAWVADKGGHAPDKAIVGGEEPGRKLIVCRAKYNNGVHPGKLVASNCNIGWGGKEITLPEYEILTGDQAEVKWVKGQNGSAPANAFIGGEEPGRKLPVCRASYNNGVHPGKLVVSNCNIGWGGKEITLPNYEVMVVEAGSPQQPPAGPAAATAGTMYSSMNTGDVGSYGFKSGSTFTQTFTSQITTYPTELGVRMGSNQNSYAATVKIAVNGKEVFNHTFSGLKQRQTDWATVFHSDRFKTLATFM